ncbi:hypothetical protein [Candidatus Clostridium stratigraminis]|uniref:Uncharacterized protein n=1 Tax=Candidatus Clostridium stratigraminis TaxID=3381661 RepID=A0ABW8T328_9CLOT
MIINTNRDGSKWVNVTKALLLFKPYKESRIHFIFWKAPKLSKFYGLKNCRFNIHKGASHKPMSIKNLRVYIRLPFFYWDKHNCGWEFGLPNLYLWWHEARVN